jgi:hypothetical protein
MFRVPRAKQNDVIDGALVLLANDGASWMSLCLKKLSQALA